jgi:hypothetical protein
MWTENSVAPRLMGAGVWGAIVVIHRVGFAPADLLAAAVARAATLLTSRGGCLRCTEMARLAVA